MATETCESLEFELIDFDETKKQVIKEANQFTRSSCDGLKINENINFIEFKSFKITKEEKNRYRNTPKKYYLVVDVDLSINSKERFMSQLNALAQIPNSLIEKPKLIDLSVIELDKLYSIPRLSFLLQLPEKTIKKWTYGENPDRLFRRLLIDNKAYILGRDLANFWYTHFIKGNETAPQQTPIENIPPQPILKPHPPQVFDPDEKADTSF